MILVVSNMYPSAKYPNYGVFVKNFVDELSKTNDVKVVSLTKKDNKLAKLWGYLKFYFKVFFAYVSGKYELAYVHYAGYNGVPILWGNKFNEKIKLIVNVHGSDVTPEKKLEEKTNFLTRKLVQRADLTVVPSTYFQEVVTDKYGEVPIYVSPSSGVNLDLFKPKLPLKKDKASFTIGYVSRIDQDKGWDLLLQALSDLKDQIPEIHLVMVGGGAQEADAIQMINDLGLNDVVTKIKMLSQAELVDVYNSLDAFIFPSTRDGESLGLVGIEAMACGAPVIGSNFGGIKTYTVHDYNGYLFAPGDQADLEAKILDYYQLSQSERQKFSEHAISTAAKYDSETVNDNLINRLSQYLKVD